MVGLRAWTAFVLSLAPAALLLVYLRNRLCGPGTRPGSVDVHALLHGGLAGLTAWVVFTLLERPFGMVELARIGALPRGLSAVYCFGLIGPVEETLKVVAAITAGATGPMLWRRRELRASLSSFSASERARPLLAAAEAGLGFSIYENYAFAVQSGCPPGPRLVTLPLVHLLFGLIVGAALVRPPGGPRPSLLRLLGALALASGLHGAYDFVLFDRTMPKLLVAPVIVAIAVVAWAGSRWALRTPSAMGAEHARP
jgi:RsiW-degrading membrane proteinase PrsW (M82 family)